MRHREPPPADALRYQPLHCARWSAPRRAYWREFGTRYVTALRALPDVEERGAKVEVPAPPEDQLKSMAAAAPLMTGAEYLTVAVLHTIWEDLGAGERFERVTQPR